jgi:uncharacterized protein (DUF2062 family)
MPHYIKRAKEKIKQFFLIDDTPHKVAAGFATGIFFGMMPSEGPLTAFLVSSLLRFNRLSAMSGVFSCNAWSTLVVLPLATTVGGFIFQVSPQVLVDGFKEAYALGFKYFFTKVIFFDILTPFFVGYFIVSFSIAFSFYFSLYLLLKYKKVRFK